MKRAIAAAAVLIAGLSTATADTIDAVVAANYPSELTEFAQSEGIADARQHAQMTVATGGASYVIAAYSNGAIGAVRLLRKTDDKYLVVDEATQPITGSEPVIVPCDVDLDGLPEAVITFSLERGGAETWIYRVADGKLRLISPTNPRGASVLTDPELLDNGNGAIDLVDQSVTGPRDNPTVTFQHYVMRNGAYQAAQPLDFFSIFYREKGTPRDQDATFDIAATALALPYRLTIANGASSGKDFRVTSGNVTLNGVSIAAPDDFGKTRASWGKAVSLQEHNEIRVRLEGKPGSRIAILIQHD